MFARMGRSPYAFVMDGGWEKLAPKRVPGTCIHRTFFEDDLWYCCRGFRECFRRFGSIQALFASAPDVWEGIALFRETMAAANGGYSKHIANPAANSACKRLHLALRWLVRRDGPVDLGVWEGISPSSLFIPLDLHVGRTARYIGFLDAGRQANDRKAVVALTGKLRELCPEDPVKYDLALFSYSIQKNIG